MNRNCSCGGTFRRSDVVRDADALLLGHVIYRDLDPLVAHWRCSKCGIERTQRKRQPKDKPRLPSQPIW